MAAHGTLSDKTNVKRNQFERIAMRLSSLDEQEMMENDSPSPSKDEQEEDNLVRKGEAERRKKAARSASMIRRNARERNRLKRLNSTFVALQSHLPDQALPITSKGNKAMSKVDILRGAIHYIKDLQNLLDENNHLTTSGTPVSSHPSVFNSEDVLHAQTLQSAFFWSST